MKLIPPFIYSYQCGSTLLTSYIPVYIYMAISQVIFDILRVLLRFYAEDDAYPRYIQENLLQPYKYLHPTKVISNLIINLMFLLSFGLSSPVLCLSLCLSGVMDIACYIILFGRLILGIDEEDIEPVRPKEDRNEDPGDSTEIGNVSELSQSHRN